MKTSRLLSDSLLLGLMLGSATAARAEDRAIPRTSEQQFEAILGNLAKLGDDAQKLAVAEIHENQDTGNARADEAELRLLEQLSKLAIGKRVSGLGDEPSRKNEEK